MPKAKKQGQVAKQDDEVKTSEDGEEKEEGETDEEDFDPDLMDDFMGGEDTFDDSDDL